MGKRNERTEFQRILDFNAANSQRDGDYDPGSPLGAVFLASVKVTSGTDPRTASAMYVDEASEAKSGAAEISASIAEELGDLSSLTRKQLESLRRSFARENHPDLMHGRQLDNANDRMSSANKLIDEAIKKSHLTESKT